MATDSVDPKTLKAAVKAVLAGVAQIGTIETRQGGAPTWVMTAKPKQNFVEISYTGSTEQGGQGVGPVVTENPRVSVEMWTPFSYEDKTEDFFDDLYNRVKNRLRDFPTLACVIEGLLGAQLPQTAYEDYGLRTYSDERSTKRVHYARITVIYRRRFTFTPTAEL